MSSRSLISAPAGLLKNRSALHDFFVYGIKPGIVPPAGTLAQITTDAISDFIWRGVSCNTNGSSSAEYFASRIQVASKRTVLMSPPGLPFNNGVFCGNGSVSGTFSTAVWFRKPFRLPKQTTVSIFFSGPIGAPVEVDLLGYRVPPLATEVSQGDASPEFSFDNRVEPPYGPIWSELTYWCKQLGSLKPIWTPTYWNNALAGNTEEEQSYQLASNFWAMALMCTYPELTPPTLQLSRVEEDENGNQVTYPFSNGAVLASGITGRVPQENTNPKYVSPLFLPEPVLFRAGSTLTASVQNNNANPIDVQVVWFGGTEE